MISFLETGKFYGCILPKTSNMKKKCSHLKSGSNSVVFSKEDCVHGRQSGLLTRPGVSALEAGSWLCLALVVVVGLRQEVLAARRVRQRRVQSTVDALTKVGCVALVVAVDLRRVDEGSVLVQLLSGS